MAPLNMSSESLEPTANVTTSPAVEPANVPPAEATATAIPIGDLIAREDYPQCVVGQTVEIRGSVGLVVQLVGQSLKVRQTEGRMLSFNVHVLRKLYGPVLRNEEIANAPAQRRTEPAAAKPEALRRTPVEPVAEPEPETAKAARLVVVNPDFDAPLTPIATLLKQADFPKCALGLHVEIAEFTGVVVELVNQSLRVLSADGLRRSYNVPALRKLYAGK